MRPKLYSHLFFTFLILISGCSPVKHLPEDEYLVKSNEIKIEDADIRKRELRGYIRQNPNRRILGIYPFYLNVYQFALNRSESRLNNWLKNSIGEPPVIYDQTLTESTAQQFELYLQRKGYFNSSVDYKVDFNKRKQRANITYNLKGNKPYTIRDIKYSIHSPKLEFFILNDTINKLINKGDVYDADILKDERQRISRNLRNEGFFDFSRDYVEFHADSTISNHQLDINIIVNNPTKTYRVGRRDSVVTKKHKRYKIDSIFISPDYLAMRPVTDKKDTTAYHQYNNNKNDTLAYYFVHHDPLKFRPSAIINNLKFEPGDYYRINDIEQTHSFLAGLRTFRFTNIVFDKSTGKEFNSDTLGYLNARVQLTPAPTNSFTIDGEGFNTAGNLGIGGNLLYQNRNIFRGAEILNIRLKGALELAGGLSTDDAIERLPFNTMELGGEFGFDFPFLLSPFKIDEITTVSRPKTTLMAGINFRERPDYTRYVLSLSYGFEWMPSRQKKHIISPLEISSIRVYNDSLLKARVPKTNPLILSSFSDHLVTGLRYRQIYNTQIIEEDVNFIYTIFNMETAGNLLWSTRNIFDLPKKDNKDNGSHTIFNIPFAQFAKADIDFRYYNIIDTKRTIVFRIMGGAGIPYGNRDVLPFIKNYYSGGANSMRAWPMYSLGPGSYSTEAENQERIYDRYGDIKLEANIEYRFAIYRIWKGAFFVEGGNVWFAKENPDFPGGKFNISGFYKDIALGAGVGTRFDFGFFVVRLDAATPIRDPGKQKGNRWISSIPSSLFDDFNFNIGIGYPF